MRAPAESDIAAGEIILSIEKVSLSFGGVRAIRDVSFDIKKGEVRAIIGPNGAGKTSMLNVINGFYTPQHGRITFKGETRSKMQPHAAARGGIARTFQNVALFKGMTALDNIMAGRTLKMRRGFLWQLLRIGPALNEEIAHRHKVEEIIDFLEIQAIRKVPVARLPYGLQKRVELGRALAMEPDLLLLDEPMAGMNLEEKEDMSRFIIDVNDHFGTTIALIEHDMGVVMDLSRPRRRARPRRQDRRRHARRGEGQSGRDRRVFGSGALMLAFGQFLEVLIAGLLAGVLYSLVALGFVLIYKASGVFNFAQGSMVLLAGLALVRSLDFLVAQGLPYWSAVIGALLFAARHHGDLRLADRTVRARPVGQPRWADAVHVHHRHRLHHRGRRTEDFRLRCLSAAPVPR